MLLLDCFCFGEDRRKLSPRGEIYSVTAVNVPTDETGNLTEPGDGTDSWGDVRCLRPNKPLVILQNNSEVTS